MHLEWDADDLDAIARDEARDGARDIAADRHCLMLATAAPVISPDLRRRGLIDKNGRITAEGRRVLAKKSGGRDAE